MCWQCRVLVVWLWGAGVRKSSPAGCADGVCASACGPEQDVPEVDVAAVSHDKLAVNDGRAQGWVCFLMSRRRAALPFNRPARVG